jgi:two-component system, NarL family, sensor histidine kinase DevS
VADTEETLRQLLDTGTALVNELGEEAALEHVLAQALALTGARYAALGVLNEDRSGLERFLTLGVDPAVHRGIGDLPRGRGVLGMLIDDPRTLLVADVTEHPGSYGFPPGHPAMHTFLGVPILIRGRPWGNLYLADKRDGKQFTEQDVEATTVLAQWAAAAIEHTRIREISDRRLEQLEHAISALAATRDSTQTIGDGSELDGMLELIVERGRALVRAEGLLIMLREGDALLVAAGAGSARGSRGLRVSLLGSTVGQVVERGVPLRATDGGTQPRINPAEFGVSEARTALLVPMLDRGAVIGVLAAVDRNNHGGDFSDEDEQLLRAFAQSAAIAVAVNRSVDADRLRSAIAAADAERARRARELSDRTLQRLAGVRVALASTVGRGDAATRDDAMRQAIEDLEAEIADLRGMIGDLRPAVLDNFGLVAAIDALVDRNRDDALRIECEVRLPSQDGKSGGLSQDLETTVYRVVQEALANVVTHAQATSVRILVGLDDGELSVEVQDDGRGFDAGAPFSGFGLAGMRTRVALAGGTFTLQSGQRGTLVKARLPARQAGAAVIALRRGRGSAQRQGGRRGSGHVG